MKCTLQDAITEQNKNNLLSFKEVADRVSDYSSDNDYLDIMGPTHTKIWIRYRARAIKGIKANRSWRTI